jgi:HEAT repeat protein
MSAPRRLAAAAALAALAVGAGSPAVRADRLGGNYRGPGDVYESRDTPGPTGGPGPAGGGGDAPPPGPSGETPPVDGEGGGESGPDSGEGSGPGSGEGGQHRGPSGEVPTDSRQPEDGGGDGTPPPDGGEGGADPGAGGPSSAPPSGPATGSPAGAGSGAAGSPGKGSSGDDRDRIWPFYFEGAKEEYLLAALARRDEPRISPPRSSTWSLSLLPDAGRPLRSLRAAARGEALALVLARLRDSDSRVRDAAVVALGKSGAPEAASILEMIAGRDRDPAVREDALLALGLCGNAAEALPPLLEAIRAAPTARGARRAAFGALGLGLLGDPVAAPPLRALLAAALAHPKRGEDASAAALALGMLGDAGAIPDIAAGLAARAVPVPVRCALLHALGKFGDHADPAARRTAAALVAAGLAEGAEIRQSAVLALGGFDDEASVRHLARALLDPDAHVRTFAAHALGRFAASRGAGTREAELARREIEKAAASEVRDRWLFQAGNVALAAASGGREGALLGLLGGPGHADAHSVSSAALALGLAGPASPEAARLLRETFGSRASGGPLRAYAGLALALAGAPGSAPDLAGALAEGERPPADVARAAALGLGLAGGAEDVAVLVGVIARHGTAAGEGGERFFLLGAAVQGLGLLGDEDLVDRLRPLLADGEWPRRAFATAALGYLLEPRTENRVAPRLSGIFRHGNFRVALPMARAVQSTL